MITEEKAQQFAKNWIDAWDDHDLERVLSHYDEVFIQCSLEGPVEFCNGELFGAVRTDHRCTGCGEFSLFFMHNYTKKYPIYLQYQVVIVSEQTLSSNKTGVLYGKESVKKISPKDYKLIQNYISGWKEYLSASPASRFNIIASMTYIQQKFLSLTKKAWFHGFNAITLSRTQITTNVHSLDVPPFSFSPKNNHLLKFTSIAFTEHLRADASTIKSWQG